VSSIFLYSDQIGKCIELESDKITPTDLVDLQSALPRDLRGISFNKPAPAQAPQSQFNFRSEARQSHVSRYLVEVAEKLLKLDQSSGALRVLELAQKVERAPQDPRLSLLRAEALLGVGRIDEAYPEIQRFLRWQPSDARAHFLLGRIYLQREDYQMAQRYFKMAKAFLPKEAVLRESVERFIEFNKIFLDRDALHTRNLSSHEYVHEIEQLRQRVHQLKAQIQTSPHAEVQGMEPHLDNLDKLFQCWLQEMA
jgi:tetratricopeptide (TPR) repeat protein